MDPEYFDAIYREADDPWGFASRWYERRKYALTLAALPRDRYRFGLEVGCSIGVFTQQLAARCDRLLAVDVAAAALKSAEKRLSGTPGVELRRWALGQEWPSGPFDLVVCSEVLYYLHPDVLPGELDRAVAALAPGGTLLAAHWRHPVADYPSDGNAVHRALRATAGLGRLGGYLDEDVVIDVFVAGAAGPSSVAALDGLWDQGLRD